MNSCNPAAFAFIIRIVGYRSYKKNKLNQSSSKKALIVIILIFYRTIESIIAMILIYIYTSLLLLILFIFVIFAISLGGYPNIGSKII